MLVRCSIIVGHLGSLRLPVWSSAAAKTVAVASPATHGTRSCGLHGSEQLLCPVRRSVAWRAMHASRAASRHGECVQPRQVVVATAKPQRARTLQGSQLLKAVAQLACSLLFLSLLTTCCGPWNRCCTNFLCTARCSIAAAHGCITAAAPFCKRCSTSSLSMKSN
jgi:hypothetical protein